MGTRTRGTLAQAMKPEFNHLSRGHFPIEPSEEAVQAAKVFLLQKWIERHHELEKSGPEPTDLSDSCKFTSIFASVVFGGEITGNYDHVFVELDDGDTLDLNEDAADVAVLSAPHVVDMEFLSNWEFHDSLKSCEPRVHRWIREFENTYRPVAGRVI